MKNGTNFATTDEIRTITHKLLKEVINEIFKAIWNYCIFVNHNFFVRHVMVEEVVQMEELARFLFHSQILLAAVMQRFM